MSSVFNQPFKQRSNCLGIRLTQESKRHDYFNRREDQLTQEDRQKKQENDELLVEALNGLTFEERQEQQELLHGVEEMTTDESTFIDSLLVDLDNLLQQTKGGSVYETAEQLDPEYVRARPFRVMFLRANRYDAKASAKQMLSFFEMKHQLFGIEKLAKDITLDDLDEDDLACLQAGPIQIPGKDRSNRVILLQMPGMRSFKTLMNELRTRYYIWMAALRSEENQLRGAVVLTYAVGDFKDKKEGGGYIENARLVFALPIYLASMHVATDDPAEYIMGNGAIRLMPAKFRARFRLHFGSHMECLYHLSTYGIAAGVIPLKPISHEMNLYHHRQWLQSCLVEEKSDSPNLFSSEPVITECNCNDVLYVGGKKSNNTGNDRLRNLVRDLSQLYDSEAKEKKRIVVDGMIGEIHKSGGRFLKQIQGTDSCWIEVPLDEVRSKITQMFRNHRRLPDALNQGCRLISGEPLMNDVVFGKTHRSRGSDLMHRLIKERSDEYNALDRGMKSQVVDAVIQRIKSEGGRFLQPVPKDGGWLEANNDMARIRISKYFRNNRRKLVKKTTS